MIGGAHDIGDTIAVFGEVHTGLLQHSTAVASGTCQRILAIFRGERARTSERPIAHAVSPDRLTGVDCRLTTASGASIRAIGSVATHVSITGGHVLQGCSATRLIRSPSGRRMPWAHYLARPGSIEVTGAADADALAGGFLAGTRSATTLDLGAVTARAVDTIQRSDALDRVPPFRAGRTMLRWAAVPVPDRSAGSVRFTVEQRQRRTVWLTCEPPQLPVAVEFCVDLALHDWLLTTLLGLVQRSGIGTAMRSDVARQLAPAVDHLLHLWMPAARTRGSTTSFWDRLDRRPGLNRQWQITVERIRDQLALSAIALLTAARKEPSQ